MSVTTLLIICACAVSIATQPIKLNLNRNIPTNIYDSAKEHMTQTGPADFGLESNILSMSDATKNQLFAKHKEDLMQTVQLNIGLGDPSVSSSPAKKQQRFENIQNYKGESSPAQKVSDIGFQVSSSNTAKNHEELNVRSSLNHEIVISKTAVNERVKRRIFLTKCPVNHIKIGGTCVNCKNLGTC